MNLFSKRTEVAEANQVERKKYLQTLQILQTLFINGAISITEIGKIVKISTPTVFSLLNELISENLIEEQGFGTSSGGRRPNLYGLKPNSFFALGINIGRFTTRIAIYSNSNEAVSETRNLNLVLSNNPEIVQVICNEANNLLENSGIDRNKILGVGIDMPGLIDAQKGINHTFLNFETPIKEIFETALQLPVFIENDAKARTFAELRFGLAKGKQNVAVLHLGWGLGTGLILNGKLYRGEQGYAGEFSHFPLNENGPLCVCGKKGCLETLASGMALARLAKEGLEQGKTSLLSSLINDINQIEPRTVVEAAAKGDLFAIGILSKVGIELGKGIAFLIQLLNPEMIILGGRLAKANQYLITPIQQSLYRFTMPELREKTQIVLSQLGQDANIIGSVAMVFEKVLETKINEINNLL